MMQKKKKPLDYSDAEYTNMTYLQLSWQWANKDHVGKFVLNLMLKPPWPRFFNMSFSSQNQICNSISFGSYSDDFKVTSKVFLWPESWYGLIRETAVHRVMQ